MKSKTNIDYSQVSILVLNWNKYDLTKEAVDSVLEHSPKEVEIILIDNGSSREVLQRLKFTYANTRVKILPIGINRYFGEGNNIGAEKAEGDILVFLNNDVVVTKGWLAPLVLELSENPDVGAVGSKFIYPDGTLQEAGAYLDANAHSVQRGKGQNANLGKYNERKEVHYVSAACVAIPKTTFLEVGGFNYIYEPAYYEDTELCFSIRAKGLKIIYQPQSVVLHKESQTTADINTGLDLSSAVEINRSKFLERWGGKRGEETQISKPIVFDKPKTKPGPTVVIFTPFDLIVGGGEKYILSVAAAYASQPCRTIFTTRHQYSRVRFLALAGQFGLDVSSIELKTISEIDFRVDVFITMGNEFFPPTQPLGVFNIHHCQFPFPKKDQSKEEISRLKRVNLVVVNSEFTKSHYIKAARSVGFKNIKVEIIRPPLGSNYVEGILKNPKQIISVGRFFVGGHTKNQHTLVKAFREVHEMHPDSELFLAGGLPPGNSSRDYLEHCRDLAKGLPVTFCIDTESSTLRNLLMSSGVYCHGSGFGVNPEINPEQCEHFGITVAEAMSAGSIPVVVGNGGPDETVEFGVSGFKYHTIEGLVRRTDLLFNLSTESVNKLRANAKSRFSSLASSSFSQQWLDVSSKPELMKHFNLHSTRGMKRYR